MYTVPNDVEILHVKKKSLKLYIFFSINQIVADVEVALENNFNEERVVALTQIFDDFGTVAEVSQRVWQRVSSGEGIAGLSVDSIGSVIKG